MDLLGSLLNRKSDISVRNGVLLYTAHPLHDLLCVPRVEVRSPHSCPEATDVNNPSVFAMLLVPLVRT